MMSVFYGQQQTIFFSDVLVWNFQEGLIQLQKVFLMTVAKRKHSESELQNTVKVTIPHDACWPIQILMPGMSTDSI